MDKLLEEWSRHERELRRWLLARAPVTSEVDDILQDVFVKILRQGERLAAVEQPRAWLFEVMRNTLTDRLRATHEFLPLPEDGGDWPAPETGSQPLDSLAQACLPRVLAELDPLDREVIELCDLQGMAQAEYARRMNLSLPAAKSRVQRARRRMRERMTSACQVSFNEAGCVDDFVPRPPLVMPAASEEPAAPCRVKEVP